MTKIKLVNGEIINAIDVALENGVLKIVTTESTVEELAEMFSRFGKLGLGYATCDRIYKALSPNRPQLHHETPR